MTRQTMKKIVFITAGLLTLAACNNNPELPASCGCDFETGNLLLVVDTNGQEGFCHVAITECDDNIVYVYDLCPDSKVVKRKFEEWELEWFLKFDTNYGFTSYVKYYQMDEPYDTTALLARLSSLTSADAKHFNDVSLLHHCFTYTDGSPVFDAGDTNLTQMANSRKMRYFKIQ